MTSEKFKTKIEILNWIRSLPEDDGLVVVNLAWMFANLQSRFPDTITGRQWLTTLTEKEACVIGDLTLSIVPYHLRIQEKDSNIEKLDR